MYPENATPLIVFGRQRAGTRFVADVLNTFREVTIQGELPNPVMRALEKFVDDTERSYLSLAKDGSDRRAREYRNWVRKKPALIYAMWANASQSRRVVPDRKCRYFGYKRPNNEFYFDFYERHFSERKPRYVYCVRNFVDNYLSIVSRWPDRSIEQVAEDYLSSLEQYNKIKLAAPDRVMLFNLDDHIRHGVPYIERNVLGKLEIPIDDEVRARLATLGAVNETDKLSGVVRRRHLSSDEQKFIDANANLGSTFMKLTEHF